MHSFSSVHLSSVQLSYTIAIRRQIIIIIIIFIKMFSFLFLFIYFSFKRSAPRAIAAAAMYIHSIKPTKKLYR